MVGRRTSSQRPKGKVEPALARRPKRNVSPKTLDISAGLSWREEKELKKALYASLQESRRQMGSPVSKHCQQTIELRQRSSICDRSRLLSFPMRATSTDDSSQDSTKSSISSRSNVADPRKSNIRAQRKFAPGSLPPTPSSTPIKSTPKPTTVQVFNRRAKTEDFLTFLCLRGTPVLPSHLDFFNFSKEEVAGESSCPTTPSGKAGGITRESSPTSSHTSSSNTQEDTSDLGRASPMIRQLRVHRKISKQYHTPIKKAARACASTPETARGLAGARPGNLRARPGRPHLTSLTDVHKTTKSSRYPPPPKLTAIRELRHPTAKHKKMEHSMVKKKSFTSIAAKQIVPVKRGRGRPKSVFHQGPPALSPVKLKTKVDDTGTHLGPPELSPVKPQAKLARADGRGRSIKHSPASVQVSSSKQACIVDVDNGDVDSVCANRRLTRLKARSIALDQSNISIAKNVPLLDSKDKKSNDIAPCTVKQTVLDLNAVLPNVISSSTAPTIAHASAVPLPAPPLTIQRTLQSLKVENACFMQDSGQFESCFKIPILLNVEPDQSFGKNEFMSTSHKFEDLKTENLSDQNSESVTCYSGRSALEGLHGDGQRKKCETVTSGQVHDCLTSQILDDYSCVPSGHIISERMETFQQQNLKPFENAKNLISLDPDITDNDKIMKEEPKENKRGLGVDNREQVIDWDLTTGTKSENNPNIVCNITVCNLSQLECSGLSEHEPITVTDSSNGCSLSSYMVVNETAHHGTKQSKTELTLAKDDSVLSASDICSLESSMKDVGYGHPPYFQPVDLFTSGFKTGYCFDDFGALDLSMKNFEAHGDEPNDSGICSFSESMCVDNGLDTDPDKVNSQKDTILDNPSFVTLTLKSRDMSPSDIVSSTIIANPDSRSVQLDLQTDLHFPLDMKTKSVAVIKDKYVGAEKCQHACIDKSPMYRDVQMSVPDFGISSQTITDTYGSSSVTDAGIPATVALQTVCTTGMSDFKTEIDIQQKLSAGNIKPEIFSETVKNLCNRSEQLDLQAGASSSCCDDYKLIIGTRKTADPHNISGLPFLGHNANNSASYDQSESEVRSVVSHLLVGGNREEEAVSKCLQSEPLKDLCDKVIKIELQEHKAESGESDCAHHIMQTADENINTESSQMMPLISINVEEQTVLQVEASWNALCQVTGLSTFSPHENELKVEETQPFYLQAANDSSLVSSKFSDDVNENEMLFDSSKISTSYGHTSPDSSQNIVKGSIVTEAIDKREITIAKDTETPQQSGRRNISCANTESKMHILSSLTNSAEAITAISDSSRRYFQGKDKCDMSRVGKTQKNVWFDLSIPITLEDYTQSEGKLSVTHHSQLGTESTLSLEDNAQSEGKLSVTHHSQLGTESTLSLEDNAQSEGKLSVTHHSQLGTESILSLEDNAQSEGMLSVTHHSQLGTESTLSLEDNAQSEGKLSVTHHSQLGTESTLSLEDNAQSEGKLSVTHHSQLGTESTLSLEDNAQSEGKLSVTHHSQLGTESTLSLEDYAQSEGKLSVTHHSQLGTESTGSLGNLVATDCTSMEQGRPSAHNKGSILSPLPPVLVSIEAFELYETMMEVTTAPHNASENCRVSSKKKVMKQKIKPKLETSDIDIIATKQMLKRKRKKKIDPDYDFEVGYHVWPTKPRKVPRRSSAGNLDNARKLHSTTKRQKLSNSDKDSDISSHSHRETGKNKRSSLKTSTSDDNVSSEQINFMQTVGPQTRAKKLISLTMSSTQLAASKKLAQVKKFREKSAKKQKRLVKMMKKKQLKEEHNPDIGDRNSAHKSPVSLKKKGRIEAEKRISQAETFPGIGDPARIVNIPTYYPTEEEFQDPLEYIQKISLTARDFGMCRLVPPASWKLESKINEEMRFTSQKQFIHKVYKRWGPNEQHTECIRQHLNSIGVTDPSPVIGGVDVDLPRLYRTIQEFGGMHNVTARKKWIKVADAMKLPKQAQDRGTKLYDTYCKFLLSYATLSSEEKRKLEHQVMSERDKREKSEIEDECIVRGKSMPLTVFSRSARNTMSVWFRDINPPTPEQVETEYWRVVNDRTSHVTVHCGHVNTNTQGSLFPTKRDSSYYRHPWNLNNLTWNRDSLLHYLVPISGASMPVIHLGMLFTTSCWSTDTHFLPYIQYLHSGADIVWSSVPCNEEEKFQEVMRDLVPTLVGGKVRWLREDTVMVPPEMLVKKGVSVGRCVQKQHEFMIVFPKTYTSTISCGYNLSESVHYATLDWIPLGWEAAQDLSASYTPELFSMDALLYTIAEDPDIPPHTLAVVMPLLEIMVDKELRLREQLYEAGLKTCRPLGDGMFPETVKQAKSIVQEDHICDISKKICFLSMVVNEGDHTVYCLEQAMTHIQKKRILKSCKLLYRYSVEELKSLVEDAQLQLDRFSSVASDTVDRKKISKKDSKA